MYRINLFVLLIILWAVPKSGRAVFEPEGMGSPFWASGNSAFVSFYAGNAVFINPALLGLVKNSRIELSYRNFYGLRELNQLGLSLPVLWHKVPLAVGVSHYGNALYSENTVRAAAALKAYGNFYIGLRLDWYFLQIKNYGHNSTLGLSAAAIYRIVANLQSGFVITNINEPEIGRTHERLPMRFALALAYKIAPGMELTAASLKSSDFDFEYRVGLRYAALTQLHLLAGLRNPENILCAGFQIIHKFLSINYAMEYHPELGASHSVGIEYDF